jgi:beta-glucanase (GH16 family)
MKSIPRLVVSLVLGCLALARGQDINLTGYTLAFDDEFNTLSATTTSPKGASNWYCLPLNSAGYYSESTWDINSLSVSGGVLSDKAFLDGSNNWHSGELLSVDPTGAGFSQTYGYFEIRCQMPNSGTGAWPAFWLDTLGGITGGQNEEVDIFEWYGVCDTAGSYQDLVQQTSHNWNANGTQNTTTAPYLPSTSTAIPNGTYPWQGYHIYGCQIDPVHMTWYIDGVQTNQCATPTSYLNTPFFVQVDYALGGGWPLSGMVNNSSFNVDWVRVYSLPTAPTTASIGVQFVGSGTSMLSTDSAGAPAVAQTNWQPLTGSSFTNVALTNNSGAATTATLSGGADGTYFCENSFTSGTGNAKLSSGELFDGNINTETHSITVASIPYTQYDVYVYGECDAAGRNATFTITPSGGSASSLSFQTESNGSSWTAGTNTWNGSGTAPSLAVGNYVHFTGLTASSFNLKFGGVGNVSMNGIQIVNTGSSVSPPSITSTLSTSGTVGSAFNYQITASNSPTSYSATGLPSGLSVNTSTGAITGTPTTAGNSSVTIGATNAGGTGTATLALTVSAAGPQQSIAIQFVGQGTALAASSSAGVPAVAQTNWKPLTGSSFSGIALTNNSGAATTASITGSADGYYFCGSGFPSGGNQTLCTGELFDGNINTETNSITISSVPYSQYDVYVYGECDAAGRNATFTLTPTGGTATSQSFQTESGGSTWTQGTSSWNGSGTAPSLSTANYVHFSGITSNTFTLKFGGVGNVGMNGIQIVKMGP